MSESASTTPTPLLFGRYRVKEQIGTGRLSTVYHAEDERLQRNVILHVLRKELVGNEQMRERFVEETNASAQRSHPALLQVFDSGEVGGRPYMVTEYVTGRPLNTVGVLSLEHALLYTRQVTGAIAACQSQGLPYPPVSSSNILLLGEGQVKLVENWLLSPDEVALDLAHYRAPDITEGSQPQQASVVYALGVLLYELITGTRPVEGQDAATVAQAHKTARISPILQVRPLLYLPTLERLLARATNRFPEQRFPNAIVFGEEIDALWRNLSNDTQRLSATPVAPRMRSTGTPTLSQTPATGETIRTNKTAQLGTHTSHHAPPPPATHTPHAPKKRHAWLHNTVGWAVTLLLILVVVLGSYSIASFAVSQLFSIELPQPRLADLGLEWPAWLGDFGRRETFIVNINAGLNMRDAPGLSTNVIAIIRNGARVEKIEDVQLKDNVEWVRVRAEKTDAVSVQGEVNGNSIEGWMSLLYLKPEQ